MCQNKDKDETTTSVTESNNSNSNGVGSHNPKTPVVVLKSAPPRWHTTALIAVLMAHFTAKIPQIFVSIENDIAHRETFLHVNFPQVLDISNVAVVRLCLGSVMILDSLFAFLYGKWQQDFEYYYPYSRLSQVRGIPFCGYMYPEGSLTSGLMTLSSFTMVAWALEGVTFILLGGIALFLSLQSAREDQVRELPVWLYQMALIGWQISAPTSLLVSAIVKYVLWPASMEQVGNNNNNNVLKHPGALLEHNWNVLSCLVEVALLGGLPLRYQDYALAPLFGLVYVLFSYAMVNAWAPATEGPQFMYPFLDTTMGWRTTACLIALLGVLTTSFAIFCALDHVITEFLQPHDVVSHVAAVVVIGAAVCRFRD